MGNSSKQIGVLIGGLIMMVVGYALSRVLLGQAATAGSDTNAPSFAGFQGISDLGPVVFISAIILAGVGMIGSASAGFLGRGPLSIAVAPLAAIGGMTFIAANTALPGLSPIMAVLLSGASISGVYALESFIPSLRAKHQNQNEA